MQRRFWQLISAALVSAVTLAVSAPVSSATPDENKNLIRSYFAAISGKAKPTEILDRYTTDEELKKHIGFFEASFPLYVLVAEDLIAAGDEVAVRARFQGTHSGDAMGIPATGKQVDVPFIIIYRISKGKIVENWMSIDQMEVMKQLGVMK